MTTPDALSEELFHFILVEIYAAIVAIFLVNDIMRAHFTVIRHKTTSIVLII